MGDIIELIKLSTKVTAWANGKITAAAFTTAEITRIAALFNITIA